MNRLLESPQSVTAIVPAYNEGNTIRHVLQVLKRCDFITQIIVIDDGSTDHTPDIARSEGVMLIVHRQNRGKSEAVRTALPHVRNNIIFFCDADLSNLTVMNCKKIIVPVLRNEAGMSVGMRDYGKFINSIAWHVPSVTGERAVRLDVLKKSMESKYFSGYGMELVLHFYCLYHAVSVSRTVVTERHIPLIRKLGLRQGGSKFMKQLVLSARIVLTMRVFGWH